MNKRHDFAALAREYITSQISLRELCRRHGITAHSLVVVQAQKGKWQEKREAYQARASESFIAKHAARMADRRAEIYDDALEAISEAITRFRADMRATKPVVQPDGSIREEPVMRLMPKDVALLLDRFHILFDQPPAIIQHQGLTLSTEFSADALREFIEATRDLAPPSSHESPLPRHPLDD